ncbi:hypothetical protein [uncultured Flavobacterium sp.]|uniref:hypothetical protein n=1 Tax=uncultured Flavobacterium sp. TaxID=165435 RepID=UPI00292F24B4|nr:hypothetical protein [uncultured Flavobacterium sp.]
MGTKTTLKTTKKNEGFCKLNLYSKNNSTSKNPTSKINSNFILVLIFILISTFAFAQSGSCNATLIVENNGNIRSTPPAGTYYSMVLTNNSSSTDTYILSAKNINNSCANTDGSSTATNVIINTDFIDSQKSTISEISIGAGQSVNFYIHVTLPVNTAVEKWSCDQITATSKNCTNYSINTVLHTYIINPSND